MDCDTAILAGGRLACHTCSDELPVCVSVLGSRSRARGGNDDLPRKLSSRRTRRDQTTGRTDVSVV